MRRIPDDTFAAFSVVSPAPDPLKSAAVAVPLTFSVVADSVADVIVPGEVRADATIVPVNVGAFIVAEFASTLLPEPVDVPTPVPPRVVRRIPDDTFAAFSVVSPAPDPLKSAAVTEFDAMIFDVNMELSIIALPATCKAPAGSRVCTPTFAKNDTFPFTLSRGPIVNVLEASDLNA